MGNSYSEYNSNRNGEKGQTVCLVFLIIVYAIAAVLSFLFFRTSLFDEFFGSHGVAECFGWLYLLALPTIGYFFVFTFSETDSTARIIIGVVVTVIQIVGTVMLAVYIMPKMIGKYEDIDESDKKFMIIVSIVQTIGVVLIHFVTLIRFNPKGWKIHRVNLAERGSNGFQKFFLLIIQCCVNILIDLVLLIKWVISIKEWNKYIFVVLMSAATVYFSSFMSFAAMFGIVGIVIVGLIAGAGNVVFSLYDPSLSSPSYAYKIYENGHELILTDAHDVGYPDEYKDQYGDRWKTDDGGNNFYRV